MLRDDPIEQIDVDAIQTVVENALSDYRNENKRYSNATVSDVLVVGSVADESRDFVPNASDLDLVISVSGATAENTVLHGFAAFLREERAAALAAASNLRVTGVDVGVYDVEALTAHVDDDFAFSCARRAVTPVTML